jgi:DNA-binding NtrC family response regulator
MADLDELIRTVSATHAHRFMPRRVRLEVVSGPAAGLRHELEGRIRIGSRELAEFVIPDPKISGLHCEVIAGAEVRVRDLGSKNGTYLGTYRVHDAQVPNGDTFLIGDSRVRVRPQELGGALELPSAAGARYGIVGCSRPIRALLEQIERTASSTASVASVLVEGETGTGKEMVVEALHRAGPRAEGPLVVVDCGAVVPTLIEAELFGHERGAFTGAETRRSGAFERAHGGTLFLDEIGELPLALQPKLLRAIESRRVSRLGSDRPIAVDVRVVSATHRDLAREVTEGHFREDLYYRLAVIRMRLPPLRERLEDLPLLAIHFLRELGADPAALLDEEALTHLMKHAWPGNVRELRNLIEQSVALVRPLSVEAATPTAAHELSLGPVDFGQPMRVGKQRVIDAFERLYLTGLLDLCNGNVSEVARRSGMNRLSIARILQRLGLRSA